jgi:hypothetical protein
MALPTLYGMTEESDTMKLIRRIEAMGAAQGLTLSRWESHMSRWSVAVNYSLHKSEFPRAAMSIYQEGEVRWARMSALEGRSKRSTSYKTLLHMANWLEEQAVAKEIYGL